MPYNCSHCSIGAPSFSVPVFSVFFSIDSKFSILLSVSSTFFFPPFWVGFVAKPSLALSLCQKFCFFYPPLKLSSRRHDCFLNHRYLFFPLDPEKYIIKYIYCLIHSLFWKYRKSKNTFWIFLTVNYYENHNVILICVFFLCSKWHHGEQFPIQKFRKDIIYIFGLFGLSFMKKSVLGSLLVKSDSDFAIKDFEMFFLINKLVIF